MFIVLCFDEQVFTSVALSASKELSRIFEYQIALLAEGMSLVALAKFSSECSMEHIHKNQLLLNINSIVHGATVVKVRQANSCFPILTLSVLIGEKELKWRVDEVFAKPALRKELLLFQNHVPVRINFKSFINYYLFIYFIFSWSSERNSMGISDEQRKWSNVVWLQRHCTGEGFS